MNRERKFELMRTLVSVFIAIVLAFGIILLVSEQPMEALVTFVAGPLQSKRYIGNIIEMAIPLIFSGLAMSVVFQASLFNLGAEGIFFISAALSSAVAIFIPMPTVFHQIAVIGVGALVGAMVAAIPGFLKAKWNASELVTSLMLNNIVFGLGLYFLNYKLRDVNAMSVVSYKFSETALLPRIIPGTRIHAGLIIALITVIIVYLILYKTKWGYEIRMTGLNKEFAKYSGINTFKVIILAHLISGFVAGMGGAVEVMGMYKRFEWTYLPGYGFDGALIAMLARNNPLGVIGSALFLAYIRVGADLVARLSDVPAEMVSILQGVIILLISAERFLHSYKQKMVLKEVK
ncbi:MAG: ABC transporter permease [Cellulosilyticaceae bacterium]